MLDFVCSCEENLGRSNAVVHRLRALNGRLHVKRDVVVADLGYDDFQAALPDKTGNERFPSRLLYPDRLCGTLRRNTDYHRHGFAVR